MVQKIYGILHYYWVPEMHILVFKTSDRRTYRIFLQPF